MAIMIDEVEDYDMEVFLAFQRVFHDDKFPEIRNLQDMASEIQMENLKVFEEEMLTF